ncbi:MAG: tetratricopeptide repeat protein [Bacteroidota bacterium]|nr:tetratricopeptide repeat protein [Bacteroidota bacterium]
MIKRILYMVVIFLIPVTMVAQEERKYNRKAIEAYKEKNYDDAVLNEQKAIEKNVSDTKLYENLGHAEFRNENYENAVKAYMKPSETNALSTSKQYYNLGNALLQSGEYDKSIKAYKNALRADPDHYNSKYNMSLARTVKQKMQQQQQQNKQDQDKKQNQDKKKQQEQKDKKQDKQDKQKQQQQQQQQKKQEMSKEDAERLLRALEKKEEDLQEEKKDKIKKAIQAQPDKDW